MSKVLTPEGLKFALEFYRSVVPYDVTNYPQQFLLCANRQIAETQSNPTLNYKGISVEVPDQYLLIKGQ